MSDYLWDKTGEAEEDVKQLEELLGQLRFQPRTFEVPATLPVVARPAPRAVSRFSWTRLAVAASLVLMLLAGAWLVFTKQRATNAPTQIVNNVAPSNGATTQPTQPRETQPNTNQLAGVPASDNTPHVKNVREQRQTVKQINASDSIPHQRHGLLSASSKRLPVPVRQSTVRDVNAQREQVAVNSTRASGSSATALTTEEKEAMSKFLLAMRVTSEKLSYAERQVQSLRESSPQR